MDPDHAQVRTQGDINPGAARVASFDAGATTRETINPHARSRSRPIGAEQPGSPSRCAIAHIAATCPCGTDRAIFRPEPASTRVFPG
ncbi:MAG TPA: hypothetical protein VF317_13795 [Dermatophilaceae bacterium]